MGPLIYIPTVNPHKKGNIWELCVSTLESSGPMRRVRSACTKNFTGTQSNVLASAHCPLQAHSIEELLLKIPLKTIVATQEAMARIGPRLTLQLEDGEHDSLRVYLDRVLADAEADDAGDANIA